MFYTFLFVKQRRCLNFVMYVLGIRENINTKYNNSYLSNCIIYSFPQIVKSKINSSSFPLRANKVGINFIIFILLFVENFS